MKNFSAKTADFDSISISGEAPVVQSDLGTAPNQIPLNKDLGTLAYMDSSGVEDINADTIELREIAAELSETAVDVFVYDTRKDSDGGAWRSRTSHTSWYNEELNTATRGSRREFPAVAVIVAEANKVTIYDGDDPDLNMWMVFEQGGSAAATSNLIGPTQATSTSVFMLNGVILVTENAWGAGLISANFISEGFIHYWQASKKYNGNISQRNDSMGYSAGYNEVIISGQGNDVAMTVLPNAPIDGDTGLPVPTIAVATDGGVSVIRDDGSVVDLYRATGDEYCSTITFDSNNSLFVSWGVNNSSCRHVSYWASIPNSNDTELTDNYYAAIKNRGGSFAGDGGTGNVKISNHARAFAVTDNFEKLTLLDHNDLDTSKSQFCDITSTYNTGWMPGDIKLAALSDTKNETVGVDETTELIGAATYQSSARLTSYTYNNGDDTVTIDNDESSDNGYVQLLLNGLIVGKKYKIEIQGSASYTPSATTFNNKIADADGVIIELDSSKQGTTDLNSLEFTASSINYLYLYGGDLTYTLSLKQTGELITNGTFDNGTTGWTDEDGLDISVVSGSLKLERDTTGGNNSYTYQSIKTIAGKRYVFSFDITGEVNGGRSFLARVGNSINTDQLGSITLSSVGSYSFDFVATGSEHYITLVIDGGVTGNYYLIDNISIRLAEDDRSVNDNGLQVFGEITKTPVAPGADLVAYSGFSADNYLMRPYNSDLNFGTGDFCYHFWEKHSGNGWIVDYDRPSTHGHILIGAFGDEMMRFEIGDNTNGDVVSPHNVWNCYTFIRRNNTCYVFHNGEQKTSFGDDGANIDASSRGGVLYLGGAISVSATAFTTGSIALFRVSATAPTDDQIAKIYRDEKVLFQDGAQATLYGTSDAVTALAYDDKTELLHVGTSGGRSDFSGLRRINNTTTAVTTSISSSNNLIAEQ